MKLLTLGITLICLAHPIKADAPVVKTATATKTGETWTISVTLSHPDTGWEHYADAWDVSSPNGETLGVRVLAHPHVNEQPFTRSLSRIKIPADLTKVLIRARDTIDGWNDETYTLNLKE